MGFRRTSYFGLIFLFVLFILAFAFSDTPPISNARAEQALKLSVSARGADIGELLRAIALQYGVNLVVDKDVTGPVSVHLSDAPFEEGLRAMLEANGFQLTKQGSLYRVSRQPQATGKLEIQVEEGRLTLLADHADVRQVVQALAEKAGMNIAIDPEVQGTVTAHLRRVDPASAVQSLFGQQFTLRKHGDIYQLSARPADTERQQWIFYRDGRVSLDLRDAPVRDVLTDLAEQAQVNLVFVGSHARPSSPGMGITLKLESLPLDEALDYITSSAGLAYRKRPADARQKDARPVYLVGEATLQPGVDNPILEQRVFWLKHLDAQEVPNLLPRDIPTTNLSVDEVRNAIVVVGSPRLLDKVAQILETLDVETDAIRSRMAGALFVDVDAEGRVTIDANAVSLPHVLRQLAIQADVDITLLDEGRPLSETRPVVRAAPSAEAAQGQQATPAPRTLRRPSSSLTTLVNLRLQKATVDEALQALLMGTSYTYRKTVRDGRTHYLIAPGNLRVAGSNPLLITRRIPLRYLSVSDPNEFLALLPPTIPTDQITLLPQQNAVAVIGTPEMVQEVEDYLRTIDSPAPQVMIEAMLLEVHRGDGQQLGLRVMGEEDAFNLSLEKGAGLRFETLAQAPRAFRASLQTLVNKNRARVLANPRVAVLNGQEATIRVGLENLFETVTEIYRGDEIPVGGVARQSFNTIQTGITLTLRPWIGAEGDITLQIHPEVRDGTRITREASTIADRSVDTQVRIPDGGLLVIGGLLQERETNVETGVPVLSDLPLLGHLFKDSNRQLDKTELIVVIQPKLMRPSR